MPVLFSLHTLDNQLVLVHSSNTSSHEVGRKGVMKIAGRAPNKLLWVLGIREPPIALEISVPKPLITIFLSLKTSLY